MPTTLSRDSVAQPTANMTRVVITLVLHALVIWGLCGATIGIGMSVTSRGNALVVHAIAAPVIAAIVSFVYFRRFNYTRPLVTASVFLVVVALVDLFLVAMVINHSFEMFRSAIGTWLPFALIFAVTFVVGTVLRRSRGME
ncbi:MAG TPA: hypothetical protein VMK12_13575 [Anaeromyxobacteraceae bacterium]|nr:hypothetical protein [Anaeromyxobacteraceae bacterium]